MSGIVFIAGLALGVLITWLALRGSRMALEAKLEAERRNVAEQRQLLEHSRAALAETFQALSGEALARQGESFLRLAAEKFKALQAEAEGNLAARQQAIDALLGPLQEVLRRYEQELQQIEASRREAYGELKQQLIEIGGAQKLLQRETANLVTALRKPQVRGRWGELSLRRLAELAGMVNHCDFEEQPSLAAEDGGARPDMLVHLPGGRDIVVDAKAPLDAYLDFVQEASDSLKEEHRRRHAAQVRRHMEQLGSKAYWSQLARTPEFVVLFLPGDPFLAAAAESDPALIEDAMAQRVVIATPSTLIALLLAVHHGWRQAELDANAQQISDLGRQLYDRIRTFLGHFEELRSALKRALTAYNDAAASLESRVLVSARRFKELGAARGEELGAVPPLEGVLRGAIVPEQRSLNEAAPESASRLGESETAEN
jgi:DNA recombination protein RmuC